MDTVSPLDFAVLFLRCTVALSPLPRLGSKLSLVRSILSSPFPFELSPAPGVLPPDFATGPAQKVRRIPRAAVAQEPERAGFPLLAVPATDLAVDPDRVIRFHQRPDGRDHGERHGLVPANGSRRLDTHRLTLPYIPGNPELIESIVKQDYDTGDGQKKQEGGGGDFEVVLKRPVGREGPRWNFSRLKSGAGYSDGGPWFR